MITSSSRLRYSSICDGMKKRMDKYRRRSVPFTRNPKDWESTHNNICLADIWYIEISFGGVVRWVMQLEAQDAAADSL